MEGCSPSSFQTCRRKRTKTDRKDFDSHQTKPETGSGKSGNSKEHTEVVKAFSTENGTEDTYEDSKEWCPYHTRDYKPQSEMHTRCDHFCHREIGFQAAAHITMKQIFHIIYILNKNRLIQSKLFTDRFHLFHAGLSSGKCFCRISGDQVDEHEDKD